MVAVASIGNGWQIRSSYAAASVTLLNRIRNQSLASAFSISSITKLVLTCGAQRCCDDYRHSPFSQNRGSVGIGAIERICSRNILVPFRQWHDPSCNNTEAD